MCLKKIIHFNACAGLIWILSNFEHPTHDLAYFQKSKSFKAFCSQVCGLKRVGKKMPCMLPQWGQDSSVYVRPENETHENTPPANTTIQHACNVCIQSDRARNLKSLKCHGVLLPVYLAGCVHAAQGGEWWAGGGGHVGVGRFYLHLAHRLYKVCK